MITTYKNATITIGGQEYRAKSTTVERAEDSGVTLRGSYSAEATIELDARFLTDLRARVEAHDQLIDRLTRRLNYANRKGRSALRRLLRLGYAVVLP